MSESGEPAAALAPCVEAVAGLPVESEQAGGGELTARALVGGCGVGVLLALVNLYMGLKTSWWESGCIIASVLGFGLLAPLSRRGGRPYSVRENVITLTVASSVGAVPAAAGLLGALPALSQLEVNVSGGALAAWGVALGTLGVLAAFLLRRRLIVEESLPFPTGAATAEVVTALHGSGAERSGRGWAFGGVTLASMAVTWLRDARGWIPSMTAGTFTLGMAWSPMLLGIGATVGPHMGLSLLLGSLVAWWGLAPWLAGSGLVAGEYGPLVEWLVWPGVGLMVGSAGVSLAGQVRQLAAAARDVRALGEDGSGRWTMGVGLAAVAAVVGLGSGPLGLDVGHLLLALLLLLPLCAVCARAAGQTDISPVSYMGNLTQVAAGALPGVAKGLPANVAAGAVTSGAAAHAGVALWALKAGHVLGVSPRRQLAAQLLGVAVGAAVSVPAYLLLARAQGLGSDALPAPAAHQFRAIAALSVGGLDGLPPHAGLAAGVGLIAGAVLALLARGRLARVLPSPMGMGIAFIIPGAYGVTLCVGALAVAAARWRWPEATRRQAPALGAGAIAGESLVGVLVAALVALGLMRPG